MNNFEYSDDNKRYHTLAYYYKHKYGYKVQKAAVNAGLTCPNIDGTKGFNGCIYCDNGSGYFTNSDKSIKKQIDSEIDRIRITNPLAKFNVYYQANTNTYTTKENLCNMIKSAKAHKDVVEVTLSTRADCITKETIDIINEYKNDININIELGLQSVNDKTAKIINRCHTFNEFLRGYNLLKENDIRTCIHIINGLPYETENMMIDTAKQVGLLRPDGLKIHLLHIIKGTKIEEFYNDKAFETLTKENYIDIVVKQLEYIPKETVIERLTGDGDKKKLVAPLWSKDKISILGSIDKLMAQKDTYQGIKILG